MILSSPLKLNACCYNVSVNGPIIYGTCRSLLVSPQTLTPLMEDGLTLRHPPEMASVFLRIFLLLDTNQLFILPTLPATVRGVLF